MHSQEIKKGQLKTFHAEIQKDYILDFTKSTLHGNPESVQCEVFVPESRPSIKNNFETKYKKVGSIKNSFTLTREPIRIAMIDCQDPTQKNK